MHRNSLNRKLFWLFAVISFTLYILIGYFTERYETGRLLIYYAGLFVCFIMFILVIDDEKYSDYAYLIGIIFRFSFLVLVPNLSDDIYRFIWDGRLNVAGINPYAQTPIHILDHADLVNTGITDDLYLLFGKNTYSSYPPLNQFIFYIAAWLFPQSLSGSILVIRTFLLAFEVGNIWLIRKLLKIQHISLKTGLLYVLNPLVILELSGNLHFEAIMIFFILLTIFFLNKDRIIQPAVSLGLSVQAKLIPLIFLPVIWFKNGSKKGIIFGFLCMLTILIPFLPFIDVHMIIGFLKSLNLYFQKFEFNASIYYLFRQLGYWIFGVNIIWFSGPVLGLVAISGILILSLTEYSKKAPYFELFLWILMIYLAMTTTLHPWYITTLIALSIFTRFRFPVVWSLMIFISYAGYTKSGYMTNYWLIALEYLVVYTVMSIEIFYNYIKKEPFRFLFGS